MRLCYGTKERAPRRGSVFTREHQREHARRFFWVGGVLRAAFAAFVVVVDLPKELSTAKLEAAEVVLSMWVVVFSECIEGGDLVKCSALDHVGEGVDAGCHHDFAAGEAFAECVVEKRDLARHAGLLNQAGEHER